MNSTKSGRIPAFQAALDDSKAVLERLNALTLELENHRLALQDRAQTVEVETYGAAEILRERLQGLNQ